jgi:sugar phosphate permease
VSIKIKKKKEPESLKKIYWELITNFEFLFTMLATCVLFYVISGILFWSTDYFTDVIKREKSDITVAFGLTSITGPVFGAISSIPLEMKVGFKSKYTLPACFVLALICYAFAFFIPFY